MPIGNFSGMFRLAWVRPVVIGSILASINIYFFNKSLFGWEQTIYQVVNLEMVAMAIGYWAYCGGENSNCGSVEWFRVTMIVIASLKWFVLACILERSIQRESLRRNIKS